MADPARAGDVGITIKIEDGNGGEAYQTFSIRVLNPIVVVPQGAAPPPPAPKPAPEAPGPDAKISVGAPDGPSASQLQPSADVAFSSPGPAGNEGHGVFGAGGINTSDSSAGHYFGGHIPTRNDSSGSSSPITGLENHDALTSQGHKLDFGNHEKMLWDLMSRSGADVDGGGSLGPNMSLFGHSQLMSRSSAHKRIDFHYDEIQVASALKIDKQTIGDLLAISHRVTEPETKST